MSRRVILWIVAGAICLHAGVFLLIANLKPLPELPYIAPRKKPNFSASELLITNEAGESTRIREFTVSTRLTETDRPPIPAAK